MRLTARGHIGRRPRSLRPGLPWQGLLGRGPLNPCLDEPSIKSRRHVKTYGRIGDLEVRLASSRADIQLAQRLRYGVFYNEMSATPSSTARMRGRDEDRYDGVCDHLLVFDTSPGSDGAERGRRAKPRVVGTYRILRQEVATRSIGFYTQGEYDVARLMAAKSPDYCFMELGRSCVLKPYRNKRTVELLWHGLWTYVRQHKVDVMIGCASFEGVDPEEHAVALSFLHHYASAPESWRVRAHDHLYVEMNRRSKDEVDVKAALKALPPLIKGYLRLGAFVGDGAVIDHQFGTTDVLIILPVEKIDPRYFEHFGAPDERESRVASAPRPAMKTAMQRGPVGRIREGERPSP